MNRIITLDAEEALSKEEIEQVAAKHSVFLQGKVWEAFRTAEQKEYKKAAELCCEILDCEVQPEIMTLLGTCYFVQGHMESAEMVFSDLVQIDSEDRQSILYLGMTKHALGKLEEAVRLFGQLYPLENYQPFYYSSYGDSLQGIGRLKQSRDVFYEEIAYFKKTGVIFSPVMLDGVFQNVLYLDVTVGNGQYPEDVKTYYDFLDQIEMTEEMQECLAGNIVHFASLMGNKWYRPLFLDFIMHIQEKGYLEGETFQGTMDSAFSSWESYQYHEDRNIGALMEDYLSAWHEEKFLEPEFYSEDEISTIKVKALAYQWYMCQYLPEHLEEVYYVRENYPHTYVGIKDYIEKVESDAAGTAEQLLDALMPYSHGSTRQKLESEMCEAYRRACEVQKNPAYVYDGEDTYRRMQPKVGRNDPCPCGSGKKYKKCCGKL